MWSAIAPGKLVNGETRISPAVGRTAANHLAGTLPKDRHRTITRAGKVPLDISQS